MAVVALVAVLMASYIALVELAAKRRRFRQADRAVSLQIDLLRRAAAQERLRERSERRRAAKNRELAGVEGQKAAALPEHSEERAGHQTVAALWAKAADGALWGAAMAARNAKQHQDHSDALAARRRQLGDRLVPLEQMAREAEAWMASPVWDETFPSELVPAMAVALAEHEARAGGRSNFPTVVGPRVSAIESTAIWNAEQMLKKTRPRLVLKGCDVRTRQFSPDHPFYWEVVFVDPKTGRSYKVQTSFGPVSIKDYLVKNP
jgi:hypothetical protein